MLVYVQHLVSLSVLKLLVTVGDERLSNNSRRHNIQSGS